jgi:hypothetical protein
MFLGFNVAGYRRGHLLFMVQGNRITQYTIGHLLRITNGAVNGRMALVIFAGKNLESEDGQWQRKRT